MVRIADRFKDLDIDKLYERFDTNRDGVIDEMEAKLGK